MARLSIVLPAFNEEENIEKVETVLASVLEQAQIAYELVFVDDGSTDQTMSQIQRVSQKNPLVKGVGFSRNFGKEAAIFAGLEVASGEAVVVMDCDLQHPPETIPLMVSLWQQGAEVVEGMKRSRGKERLSHKLFAGLFYDVMSHLMKMDMRASSDFKLLDRKVVDVLLALPERNTFFRALSFWVGFRTQAVYYEVQERQFGTSKWSLWSLMRYAIANITSFSTVPLRLVMGMGMVSTGFGMILAVQTLVRYLMGNSVEGFTTVILLLLMIGGLLMISLGIIGHYLARIYEEVKGRPKYIIRTVTDNVTGSVVGAWKSERKDR